MSLEIAGALCEKLFSFYRVHITEDAEARIASHFYWNQVVQSHITDDNKWNSWFRLDKYKKSKFRKIYIFHFTRDSRVWCKLKVITPWCRPVLNRNIYFPLDEMFELIMKMNFEIEIVLYETNKL